MKSSKDREDLTKRIIKRFNAINFTFFFSRSMHKIDALGAERAFLGCGVPDSQLLIYILDRKLLGEFSDTFRFQHCNRS